MKLFSRLKARSLQTSQRPAEDTSSVPVARTDVHHPTDPRSPLPISDLSDADIREAMTRWSLGLDAGAGRQLIAYFHRQMQQPDYSPELLLEFIGQAFGRMVAEGISADQAFGLIDPGPETPKDEGISLEGMSLQDRAIALTIEHQKRFDPYRGALKRAYVITADTFGVTSARARDIHTASADWLSSLSDEEVKDRLAGLKR